MLAINDRAERRINIIENEEDTTLSVTSKPLLTSACNIITAQTICVPFPLQTTNREYAVSKRGFFDKDDETSMAMAKMILVNPLRPRIRWFWDKRCMVMRIGAGTERGRGDALDEDEVYIVM